MAEPAARSKMVEAKDRLLVLTKGLSDSVARDNNITPTLVSLRRKLTEGKEAWQAYDAAHFALVALLTQTPAPLKVEREAYQEQYQLVTIAQDLVEELIEKRVAAEKIAAAPPVADAECEYSIARNQRLATYKLQESKVKMVEEHFGPPIEGAVKRKESIKGLENLSKLLDEIDVLIKDGSWYTGQMIKHKPAANEVDIATDAEQVAAMGRRVAEQRDLIAGMADSIMPAAPATVAPEIANRHARGGGDSYMYQRRPKPSFDGQKRNYPSFRREWLAGVTGKFDADYEVREIKYNVPAEVEPDLKNLQTMKSIWAVLDSKYGKTMDLSMELVTGLQRFSFTKGANTETSKFQELFREWVKVYNDLEQVQELVALDHKPTLCNIAKMLPSEASKMRYAVLRIKRKKENEEAEGRHGDAEGAPAGLLSELDIMNEFMRSENELQETFEHLLNPESTAKAKTSGPLAGGRTVLCYKCGKAGHQKNQCTERGPKSGNSVAGGATHASAKEPATPCPACNQHHPFTPFDPAAPKYRSRFSACDTFRKMSVPERASLVEKVGGCALCLEWTADHKRENCTSKGMGGKAYERCSKMEGGKVCGKLHSRLLHGATTKYCCFMRVNSVAKHGDPVAPTPEDLEANDAASALLQVESVPMEAASGKVERRTVFWDTGSNVNLAAKALAEAMGWPGFEVELSLRVTGKPSEVWKTTAYWARLVDREGEVYQILCYELPTITAPLGQVDVSEVKRLFPHLASTDLVERPTGEVDLLIGIQHAGMFPTLGSNKDNVSGNLRLLTSKFGTGHLLDGEHPSLKICAMMQSRDSRAISRSIAVPIKRSPVEKLSCRVAKEPTFSFSECEEMGVNQPRRCGACDSCSKCSEARQDLSRREQAELKLIEANISLDEENKQVTFKYPLLKDPFLLTDNRNQVVSMAHGLERQLIKSNQLADFNDEMEGFVHRGVFRELTEEEMRRWTGALNYISIHGVPKPQSTTTKLRVVSNSSLSNNNSGFSYNSLLPKGPNSLVSLLSALVRWRSYEHCVVWDLTKAYNTVVTFPEEMHMRRLVWRWGCQDQEWKTYGITRMHFGDVVAMCGLDVSLKRVAEAGRKVDPEAAEMLAHGYVDDGLGGGDEATVDKLIGEETWEDEKPRYSGTVQQILGLGSFGLKVMVRDGESRPEVLNLLGGGMLGLPWEAGRDVIKMHIGVNISPKKRGVRVGPELTEETIWQLDDLQMTKRIVVSQVYGVFDPLGLLSPLVIKYKLLLQRLSTAVKLGWDDPLEEELAEEARAVLREMVLTRDIEFRRSVRPAGTKGDLELVGWWDGGNPASNGCLYTRYECTEPDPEGRTHKLTLLLGKARVTPSKGLEKLRKSTPRTELRGLLLLVRMTAAALPALSLKPKRITLCGDSECTISAVECEEGVLQVWFSNRVAEIVETMDSWGKLGIEVDPLMHWPGLRNVADIGTKGKAVLADIDEESEWQNGPREASFPRNEWPASREFRREVPEEEKYTRLYVANLVQAKGDNLFTLTSEVMERHNKFNLVKAILARWLAANKLMWRPDAELAPTAAGLKIAEELMFMTASLETGCEMVSEKNRLIPLSPISSHGKWVTQGRLRKGMQRILGVSELPLLMPGSRLSMLVMIQAHNEDHKGADITLWRSRSKAWVVQGRALAVKVEKSCLRCVTRKGLLREQRMGALPVERLAVGTPPFTAVCLDFMGPILVRDMVNKRSSLKAYPILLVCQATGALHTEVAHNYSTDAFLLAYDHFTSVRGHPAKVVSDRGSQLTSKSNLIAFEAQEKKLTGCSWEEVQHQGARRGTTWHFVPAGAQFQNGLAEARVKAEKHTMAHMLTATLIGGKPTINYAELQTILSQAANIVNDRPIGVKGLREGEPIVPLTVNQLLLGRTSSRGVLDEEEVVVEDFSVCSAYGDKLLDTWWSMWRQQGFSSLLPYYKYKDAKRHRDMQVGDICNLFYDNKVKGTYRLCQVVKLYPSDDGLVRRVDVGFRPRRSCGSGAYKSVPLDIMNVTVQRLVLIVPVEEATVEAAD